MGDWVLHLLKKYGRSIRRRVAARGRRGVIIFVYHHVADDIPNAHDLTVSTENFAAHMEILQKWGTPVRVKDIPRMLNSGELPKRGYAVTFDDGYLDNFINAQPLLLRYGTPATIYVATGFSPGGDSYWWDILEEIRSRVSLADNPTLGNSAWWDNLESELSAASPESIKSKLRSLSESTVSYKGLSRPMSVEQLSLLSKSGIIDIGAHTVYHRRLYQLTPSEQRKEIAGSKQYLENALGQPSELFAYPFGFCGSDFDDTTKRIVADAGFSSACAVRPRWVTAGADRFDLPRYWVSDWAPEEFARRLRAWSLQ